MWSFGPFLDFLTSDNRGVGHAHAHLLARVQPHNQFQTFTIVFFETLRGDKRPSSMLRIDKDFVENETHSGAHKCSHIC